MADGSACDRTLMDEDEKPTPDCARVRQRSLT
jgi:hypothetical protein